MCIECLHIQECGIACFCHLFCALAVPPSAPTITSVSASSSSSLLVMWDAPANNGGGPVMSYIIEYKPTNETGGNFSSVIIGAGVPLEATIHNLMVYSFYDVQITATNVAGNGDTSTTFQPPVQTHPGGLELNTHIHTHTHTHTHTPGISVNIFVHIQCVWLLVGQKGIVPACPCKIS